MPLAKKHGDRLDGGSITGRPRYDDVAWFGSRLTRLACVAATVAERIDRWQDPHEQPVSALPLQAVLKSTPVAGRRQSIVEGARSARTAAAVRECTTRGEGRDKAGDWNESFSRRRTQIEKRSIVGRHVGCLVCYNQ